MPPVRARKPTTRLSAPSGPVAPLPVNYSAANVVEYTTTFSFHFQIEGPGILSETDTLPPTTFPVRFWTAPQVPQCFGELIPVQRCLLSVLLAPRVVCLPEVGDSGERGFVGDGGIGNKIGQWVGGCLRRVGRHPDGIWHLEAITEPVHPALDGPRKNGWPGCVQVGQSRLHSSVRVAFIVLSLFSGGITFSKGSRKMRRHIASSS
jgi:hypothetical protein